MLLWGRVGTAGDILLSYLEVGKQGNSWRLCLCLAPCSSLFLHPNYFSCVHCQALSVIFWLHLPSTMVKKPYGLLCGEEAACHPVALGCDIHQVLTSVLSLKPLLILPENMSILWAVLFVCWCCCTCCCCPRQKVEVMAEAGGSRGRPQGDVAAASWESPSSLDEKLWLHGWLPWFQTGSFFPLLFLCSPVLWKKSKSRLQFSAGRKEGETVAQIFFRGYLRWFSDDGGRGVCQEIES